MTSIDADAGSPCAAGRSNARKACRKNIEVHLLAAHQPFELGDAGFGEHEGGALVVVRRWRLQLTGTWLGSALAVQPIWPIGLPRLDPVVEILAGDSKLAGYGQNAVASLNSLDCFYFVGRRKLTVLSLYCHRSSLKCLSL
ncbi:hypothetical protein ACM43_00915 [Bradyrhizobium sp. CCBAU 45321]|nr:hypothetical protein [Bradyrhizobium sp. CCBAU 45321]